MTTLGEVLQEQLADLISHGAHCGRPLCPDCSRFRRASVVLLEPFDDVLNPPTVVEEARTDLAGELTPTARWLRAVRRVPRV